MSIMTDHLCDILLLSDRPMGTLLAVKESLLQMRHQRDRFSVTSSPSGTTVASTGVHSAPMHSPRHEDTSSVTCIATELVRYVLDDEALATSLFAADDKTTVSHDEARTSSDPRVVGVALQNQQLRAEVLTSVVDFDFYNIKHEVRLSRLLGYWHQRANKRLGDPPLRCIQEPYHESADFQ